MVDIKPLSEALGAEISGVDLSQPLDDETESAIRDAFLEHHLLCFRSAPLEPSDFARVADYFGTPQLQLLRKRRHDETPAVSILESTYKRPEDKPDDMNMVRLSGWHTDDSYFAKPAKATMLQSLQIPESGGETKFCNMRKAYLDLPAETRERIDGLRAVHSYDTLRAPARAATRTEEEKSETPDVDHPLVRTHEDTGGKSIYFNSNRTDRIVGMPREESDALLDMLYDHVTRDRYQYHHTWRVGDLLLWDNRCLMHAVNMDFPVGQTRLHQRILLEGAHPV
ncbi:MAG: TauD/TfdA family dioxygenase [Pseudomonadota bacterium]